MSDLRVQGARLFLDANVLISAAWKNDSKVTRIWRIPDVELVTSNYIVAEYERNLPREEQRNRLVQLLLRVRILTFQRTPALENSPDLPEKDQRVFAAAVLARADFLVTGDRKHFGGWFGMTVLGLKIEPPGRFPQVLDEG
jgi:predicted nucleic acid-binding protein